MFKKFIILFAALAVIFIIGQSRLLSVNGVNPNLFLVFFLLIAFNAGSFLFILALALATLLFIFVFTPSWFPSFGLASLLVLAFYFLKRFLTGTALLDYLLLVLAGTLLFYFLLAFPDLTALPLGQILSEALSNLILGVIMWFVVGEKIRIND